MAEGGEEGLSIRIKEKRETLCESCRNATVVRKDNLQKVVYCSAISDYGKNLVNFVVKECSKYSSQHEMQLWEMERCCWLLETRGRTIGFHAPKSDKHEAFLESHRKKGYVDPMSDT